MFTNKLFKKSLNNLHVIESTNGDDIVSSLKKLDVKHAHFTNGTFAFDAKLIVLTVLAGFKHVVEKNQYLPLIVAVNSDKSMEQIGKLDIEAQKSRASKVAAPLAEAFPSNKVIVLFYDETTPNELYKTLKLSGYTHTLHKWGYGTQKLSTPKIEGAELFDVVYAYPLPNDKEPVCWKDTPFAEEPQNIEVVDLRKMLIDVDDGGVLFELPENLKMYQSEKYQLISKEEYENMSLKISI